MNKSFHTLLRVATVLYILLGAPSNKTEAEILEQVNKAFDQWIQDHGPVDEFTRFVVIEEIMSGERKKYNLVRSSK